jgi:hypothetical protein
MAVTQFPDRPRKRRTRQHVIADQSVNHVERLIIDEGHVAHRVTTDYGYDLVMNTFDGDGYAEPGVVFLQLKASDALTSSGQNYAYDLDIRDYNLWKIENQPVYLVLFDAVARRAYWLHVQNFFRSTSRRPRKGAKTVRVWIPTRQVLNRKAVARMRASKNELFLKVAEEP